MILWLNGTFGSGKTSTAAELIPLLPGHRLFDPEAVGQMLSFNLQDIEVADFQDHPPWRPLVASTAVAIAGYTVGR